MSKSPFRVEPFQPADAEEVSHLFIEVYGSAYPIKMVYDPGQLVAAFESHQYFPFVVRSASKQIIGYGAMYRSAPYEGIYEFGQGIVSPDFRGAGIGRLMFEFVGDYTPTLPGSEMLFGEPVCNHMHTQKTSAMIKTIETAIEIDLMPGEIYKKDRTVSGRVAVLDMFRTFIPKPHSVYIPGVYENIIRYIYGGFDDSRTLVASTGKPPSNLSTEMSVQVFEFARVARVAVTMAGPDFEHVFNQEEHILLNRKILVIQVWLNASWPWIGEVVEILRNRGYFFGGVFPRWFDMDGLFMQKVRGQPNWEEIHLYSDRAEKILGFVSGDWKDLGRRSGSTYGK